MKVIDDLQPLSKGLLVLVLLLQEDINHGNHGVGLQY
jgi:hypothetical protein